MPETTAADGASTNASFKTRARTVDHLGRGQIADAPTAVSELWKNAWDAYSNSVSLNIFEGDPVVAAIFDAGIGMSGRDFVERWLVIGTESKVDGPAPSPPSYFLGKPRPRQGEKGIGRLSTAFLAPATLVVSCRGGDSFSAVLVDWRLFENPFLALEDIVLPVRTFDTREDILPALPEMVAAVLDNLGPTRPDGTRDLVEGWSDRVDRTTGLLAQQIQEFWSSLPIARRHLDEWPVFAGLETHGTALFLLGAHHELSVWLHAAHEDEEAKAAKGRLTDILTGFTDSLSEDPVDFGYEVLIHRAESARRVLSSSDVFDLDDFRDLEHSVEGSFDDKGVFRGRVRAFGKDLGERELPPIRPLPPAARPGPFRFAIGTFEQVQSSSTHNIRRHKELLELAARYGGVRVYRDDLRVMPYGSTDADFFGLEEQRQKHAGRYFWAHRRSFGRLAFTREDNPNLRDKAGREGLVENQASRQLRLLVQSLLLRLALEYFGTDAPERAERIAEAKGRNLKARQIVDQARKERRSAFRSYLSDASMRMPDVLQRARDVAALLQDERIERDRQDLALLRGNVERVRAEIAALSPVEVPSTLGDLELRYRAFRDDLDEAGDLVTLSESALRTLEATVGRSSARDVILEARAHHARALDARLDRYHAEIREGIKAVTGTWTGNIEDDRNRYEQDTAPIVRGHKEEAEVADVLALLETTRRELENEFDERYRVILRNIADVVTGFDVRTALAVVDDDREELDRRVRDLNAVAQLGITVEIIGHELETLDGEITRGLENLPAEVRATAAYKRALDAHRSMTEKLRFLSPLQLAGARVREQITGEAIYTYVREFFGPLFDENGIEFDAAEAFKAIRFIDLKSRIFPVFVNLVNNAIYWVGNAPRKLIRFGYEDGKILVADTGPGVDRDDVARLFQLFYTRRTSGRGVGLYLCRVNLEAGRHSIRYATETDPHILEGANFVIELRGVSHGG